LLSCTANVGKLQDPDSPVPYLVDGHTGLVPNPDRDAVCVVIEQDDEGGPDVADRGRGCITFLP
jgi:hypothetical protein